MKYVLLIVVAIVLGLLSATTLNNWAAETNAAEPTVAKTITITKAELEAMVSQRMAQAMLEDTRSMHEAVLQEQNWHSAIFKGIEYTIYSGPGEIASVTVAVSPTLDKEEE